MVVRRGCRDCTIPFANKHQGPFPEFGILVGGGPSAFWCFVKISLVKTHCIFPNREGGGLLARNSIMLVPTGRALVLIREEYCSLVETPATNGYLLLDMFYL